MWKAHQTRELYKCTLQQKAVQDIFKAFSTQTEELDLGERAKLNHRGTNLLLDLIKASDLKKVKYGDCVLNKIDLKQIKIFLMDEVNELEFRQNTNLGIDGVLFLKGVLKRKAASSFALVECELTTIQLKIVIESLREMNCAAVEELNLRGNSISKEGVSLITHLIRKKNLKRLILSKCFITAGQLKILSEGINKMKGTMDTIDLRENMIPKKDTEFFRKTVENKIVEVITL